MAGSGKPYGRSGAAERPATPNLDSSPAVRHGNMDPQLREDYEERELPPPWLVSQVWRSLCVWGVVVLLARGLAYALHQLSRLG